MPQRKLLIEKRENKNLKQIDVAKLVNTTQQNISMLENGKRNPTVLIARYLENLYNTPMEQLFPDIFLTSNTTKCS